LAWLVGNTEGDLDEALRASHRSLELAPETSGYLDTLGRCYFARGDCEKAVKYQSRAVDLDPHSGQIRRQLDFFKQALQTAKAPQK
jgi:Flp pilus assembly protein TadD